MFVIGPRIPTFVEHKDTVKYKASGLFLGFLVFNDLVFHLLFKYEILI